MAPLNILIIGCSIGGPTLASFLLLSDIPASQKPRITILERASEFRKAGQNVDIRGAGVTIIRKLGLEALVRASTTGEEGVRIVDSNDAIWAAFPVDKSGKWQTPTSDIEICRGRLAELCYSRSKSISGKVQSQGGVGVEYIFGDNLESLDQDGDKVHVRFAKSGDKRTFDLVVGADGLQSSTRKLVWGSEGDQERVKRLGMYAAFFSLPRGETDSLWRRWYHTTGGRGIMLRPDVHRNRTTVLMSVVSDTDKRLPDAAKNGYKGMREQKQLFEEYFRDGGWESERVIRAMNTTDDFYYDMVAQVKMDKWSKGRVVLLGDAGYCASPLSGMGTTLAMSGAYNLAGALARHPDNFSAAFSQYEKSMRPTVERAQKLAPGMPHLINPQTAWGVWLLQAFAYCIFLTRVHLILVMFFGPPANNVPVEEYGFKQVPEDPIS